MNTRPVSNISEQRGVASLIVILILLVAITGITLYSAQTGIMEQKISTNDYRSKQLSEAADAGIDFAVSWLATNTPTWSTFNSDWEADTGNIQTTVGNYTVSVELWRPLADPKKVTVIATANETGNANLTASTRTTVLQKSSVAIAPNSAIMINGCIQNSGGSGNLSNINGAGAPDVRTSKNTTGPGACTNQLAGFVDTNDGAVDVATGAFDGSALENAFGMTLAELHDWAAIDPDVYWETQSTPWNPPVTPLGSVSDPVIVVFTECPRLNGSFDLYGLVYFSRPCDGAGEAPGWGNATIHGSVIFEGNVNRITANAEITYDPAVMRSFGSKTFSIKSRIAGTWFDEKRATGQAPY